MPFPPEAVRHEAARHDEGPFEVRAFTPACADHLARGEHALIGVSAGNSYFTQQRLTQLLRWAGHRFASVDLLHTDLHLDSMHRACGADEEQAAKRTKRALRDVRRRTRRAVEAAGDLPASIRSLALSETVDLPGYRAARRLIDREIEADPRVRKACEDHVVRILGGRTGPGDARFRAGMDYLRAELPYLLRTPEVFRVPSSVCCYHALLPVVEELHGEGSCFHPGQGHAVVRPLTYDGRP